MLATAHEPTIDCSMVVPEDASGGGRIKAVPSELRRFLTPRGLREAFQDTTSAKQRVGMGSKPGSAGRYLGFWGAIGAQPA